jgi:hypothetical protein
VAGNPCRSDLFSVDSGKGGLRRLDGGVRSQIRTGLRPQFPAIREISREFCDVGAFGCDIGTKKLLCRSGFSVTSPQKLPGKLFSLTGKFLTRTGKFASFERLSNGSRPQDSCPCDQRAALYDERSRWVIPTAPILHAMLLLRPDALASAAMVTLRDAPKCISQTSRC